MPVYRSRIFSPIADPFEKLNPSSGILDLRDGFIDVENGKIIAVIRLTIVMTSAARVTGRRHSAWVSRRIAEIMTPA